MSRALVMNRLVASPSLVSLGRCFRRPYKPRGCTHHFPSRPSWVNSLGARGFSIRPEFNKPVANFTPRTWIDYLPAKVRPYLYLTRIDKPIGTLLLFYPCSASGTRLSELTLSKCQNLSLVDHYGFVRLKTAMDDSFNIHQSFWRRGTCHAWRRVHHK